MAFFFDDEAEAEVLEQDRGGDEEREQRRTFADVEAPLSPPSPENWPTWDPPARNARTAFSNGFFGIIRKPSDRNSAHNRTNCTILKRPAPAAHKSSVNRNIFGLGCHSQMTPKVEDTVIMS